MPVTSLTHALSHVDAIAGPTLVASSRTIPAATAGAEAPTAVTSLMPAIAETLGASTMPLIGAVDAASATAVHTRLSASATPAHRARREKRTTPAATGMDTGRTVADSPEGVRPFAVRRRKPRPHISHEWPVRATTAASGRHLCTTGHLGTNDATRAPAVPEPSSSNGEFQLDVHKC